MTQIIYYAIIKQNKLYEVNCLVKMIPCDNLVVREIYSVFVVNLTDANNSYSVLPQNTLCYKLSGASRHTNNDCDILLKEGMVLFLPKNVEYKVTVEEPGESIAIGFGLVDDTIPNAQLAVTTPSDTQKCYSIFAKLLSIAVSPEYRFDRLGLFYQLMALFEDEGRRSIMSPKLNEAVKHIEQRYADCDLTENELAELCGYSVGYFRRAFTKALGKSPIKYIISLRMSNALSMLRSGFFTVSEIALKVGYNDVYYFSNAFKHEFGVSPTRWREIRINKL